MNHKYLTLILLELIYLSSQQLLLPQNTSTQIQPSNPNSTYIIKPNPKLNSRNQYRIELQINQT